MSAANEGDGGWQVILIASGSFLPPADTTALILSTPGLIGPSCALSFTGTVNPGVVHWSGANDWMAAWSAAAPSILAGVTLALVTPPVTPHVVSPRQAASGNVHTPLATPSWSQAEPSTHVVLGPLIPLHVTMQSVAAGPPPAKQSAPEHAAAASLGRSKDERAITKPRRMDTLRGENIPEGGNGVNVRPPDQPFLVALLPGRLDDRTHAGGANPRGVVPPRPLTGARRARDVLRGGRPRQPGRPAGLASVELVHVCCLKPLGPLRHLELHALALFECPEPRAADRAVVHEDVLTLIGRDEAVPLLAVEPLDLALCHGVLLPSVAIAPRRIREGKTLMLSPQQTSERGGG